MCAFHFCGSKLKFGCSVVPKAPGRNQWIVFGKKYIEGSLCVCVCVFVLFKHRCSLSYFQCYFCPVGDDYKRGGESVGAQSKKTRVLICEQH